MPKRNKLVYSGTIKIRASGFDELLESIFYLLLVVKAFSFSLQKVVRMLEEAVVSWLLGSMADETNFIAQFVQLLKRWLCNMQFEVVMKKNRVLSVEHCWLQGVRGFGTSH